MRARARSAPPMLGRCARVLGVLPYAPDSARARDDYARARSCARRLHALATIVRARATIVRGARVLARARTTIVRAGDARDVPRSGVGF